MHRGRCDCKIADWQGLGNNIMAEEEAPEVEAGGNEGGSGYALMTDAWPDMVKVGQAEYHVTHRHIINIDQKSWAT